MKKLVTLLISCALAATVPVPAFAALGTPAISAVSSASTSGVTAATVTWTPVTDAVSYLVTASASGHPSGSTSQYACQSVCTATVSGSVNSPLDGGISYSFKVTAISSGGAQNVSAESLFVVQSLPGMATPGTITQGNGELTLNWVAPTNSGGLAITGYSLKDDSGSAAISVPASSSSYTIKPLTVGQTKNYSIAAKNSLGTGEYANFTAAVVAGVPSVPAAPTLSLRGTNSIDLSWVAPNANGKPITGYTVALYKGTDLLSSKSASTTSASFDNLDPANYTATVTASNELGTSAPSAKPTAIKVEAGAAAANATLTDNTPVFSPSVLPNLVIGQTQSISVTAPSGGTPTVTAVGTPANVCTYLNGVITAVATGTCSVSASVPQGNGYAAGLATKTFSVKGTQTIQFAAIPEKAGPGTITLTATAIPSAISVTFAAVGTCTLSGYTLTYDVGSCTVVASAPANNLYAIATPVARTFLITEAVITPPPSAPITTPAPPVNSGGNSGQGSTAPPAAGVPTPPTDQKPPVVDPTPTPQPKPTVTPEIPKVPAVILQNPAQASAGQVAKLTTSQFAVIPANVLANLPAKALAAITPAQAAVLRPNQITKLSASGLNALKVKTIAALAPQTLAALSRGKLASLTAKQIAAITPRQLAALTVSQRKAIGR
ncbi:MAG: hypothetical protein RIR34_1314 [Actinomycetota bacterium]